MQSPAITSEQAFALAIEFRRSGDATAAAAMCERIVAAQPNHANAWHLLGATLGERGYYIETIDCLTKALPYSPTPAICHSDLGLAYLRLGQLQQAVASLEHAIMLQPDLADAHSYLAETVTQLGEVEKAIAHCRRAIEINDNHIDARSNWGTLLAMSGEWSQAIQILQDTIARKRDHATAHWNLALIFLRMGRFQEGWTKYEWRWGHPGFPSPKRNFTAPMWNGQSIPGKTLLIHWEQGLGDTIQFLRYVPLIHERCGAARVIVECQEPLVRLVQSAHLGADIIRPECLPPFDLYLPLLSLPFALKHFDPLPMQAPYLHASGSGASNGARMKVGLVWAGDPGHPRDRHRSVAFDLLRPLLDLDGIDFHSLQIGSPLPDNRLIDLTQNIADFADTAARMSDLDLIITVDTAAAHLAGALGMPVWVLLDHVSDWRWSLEREDTPWYPTMRLFRQQTPGDWKSVVSSIMTELRNPYSFEATKFRAAVV